MFSLMYAWINDWVNNREAGDLRLQHGHYDVIVMEYTRVKIITALKLITEKNGSICWQKWKTRRWSWSWIERDIVVLSWYQFNPLIPQQNCLMGFVSSWRHQMKTFSALLVFSEGNSQRPVTRSFDVFLICVWIYCWVNNREGGEFRRHRAHYYVTVMCS